jgi:hypothetical protein
MKSAFLERGEMIRGNDVNGTLSAKRSTKTKRRVILSEGDTEI